MNIRLITIIALCSWSIAARAELTYTCIVDLATGFHHDSERDSWRHAQFLPGEKFNVRQIGEEVFRVSKADSQIAWSAICLRRTDQSDDAYSCEQGTDEFHFNRKELRFTSFRYFGYWNGSKDSLSISIGKCSET